MAEEAIHNYSEDKIQTLSALEHIKQRPGMYIGRLGNGTHQDDGIYVLLKEIVDNSVDEYVMGFGKKIDVEIIDNQSVRVRDYGRGIPLGKLVDCVSLINTGAKYNSEVFQFSVGLNGVGTKAVNALSQRFEATSFREGKFKKVIFEGGILKHEEDGNSSEENGTEIYFTPGEEHFKKFRYDEKFVKRKLWNYAYLNSGLILFFDGDKFFSRNGLYDLLCEKTGDEKLYEPFYYKGQTLEFAMTHTGNYGETYFSFVNGQFTNDGGTHQSAFKEGILKAVNEFSGKNFNGDDVRNGIVGAIAIKLKEPIFESQTKNKLGNSDIRADIVNQVKAVLVEQFYKNREIADQLIDKIMQSEKLRKDIQDLKKKSKETEKKASIKIPKLRDCQYHLTDPFEKKRKALRKGEKTGDDSMIFLTEGQSASGSMIKCRNPLNQAIFSLKGKPMNCFGQGRDFFYKNEELYYIMQALGIEDGIDDLRYSKVILATDADVDGSHIRNLLITFFLTYFEPLISSEHLFILETPLFRVRNTKETIYCYDEEEKLAAMAKLGKSNEVTRFKGLGEISPDEFGPFMGETMRLQRVTLDNIKDKNQMLEFYMGENTPSRKNYIMQNLLLID